MPQKKNVDQDQQNLLDSAQEAGVKELMDLYERVEEVYVASSGTFSSVPAGITTDSTNLNS
jgi:hypothetical protein